ncbi:MAG: hypothetical protein ACT4OD_01755 [Candidatus Nitrosotenuis sp.]
MCVRDHDDSFRRGRKQLVSDKKEDEMESHFKTSMLFQKSMKSL